jgi:hypothetical protein
MPTVSVIVPHYDNARFRASLGAARRSSVVFGC